MLTPVEYGFPGTWTEINLDGAFFRGTGTNALAFNGGIQADAIRNITGSFSAVAWTLYDEMYSGAFSASDRRSADAYGGNSNGKSRFYILMHQL